MKVGSLVECVNNKNFIKMIPPKLNTIYEVRGFNINGGLWLEEIHNEICPYIGDEWGYNATRFRELLPPMSITIEQFEYEKA
jgi:hypothetical protein